MHNSDMFIGAAFIGLFAFKIAGCALLIRDMAKRNDTEDPEQGHPATPPPSRVKFAAPSVRAGHQPGTAG